MLMPHKVTFYAYQTTLSAISGYHHILGAFYAYQQKAVQLMFTS
jgi:hypothetical protein